MKITLTIGEMHLAAQNGCLRQIESMAKGLQDKHGFEGPGWNIHIEGAAGEIAVAKALGIYWGGSVNSFRTENDVGKFEVRTASKNGYKLIVREQDKDSNIYILVTGSAPHFEVVGWMYGGDAKQKKYENAPNGRAAAYFVPQSDLRAIDELKELM